MKVSIAGFPSYTVDEPEVAPVPAATSDEVAAAMAAADARAAAVAPTEIIPNPTPSAELVVNDPLAAEPTPAAPAVDPLTQ